MLERAVGWASRAVGGDVEVVDVLAGGTHAATYLVQDASRRMVLRCFPEGDDAAANEARVLTALDGLSGFGPHLVAADPGGRDAGRPSTLITVLPGRADIQPIDPNTAAVQLGRALARVHFTPVDALSGFRDGVAEADTTAARRGTQGPASAIVGPRLELLADEPRVLTHFDFWSGNVLWDGDALTGVVDWAGGCLAPRGFDVGWCRLDLHLLHGPEPADVFLRAYESAAGRPVTHLELWDLFTVRNSHATVETWSPNYTDLGRADLTARALRDRHTSWTRLCLQRWTVNRREG